ncbi:hypothetical protein H4S02_004405, partial [Coemansia sp. RSA 2611]
LTRILQPSLGGNAKTLIVCTITPSPDYIDEALSTLKFASRAKTIRNTPEVNEELRGDALLRRLKRASELEKEIAQMKEIERKKIKIEADNEALLRQLWKSQKERERLQRELELQQNSVFLPRASPDSRTSADDASAIRRQTWFPGLQGPLLDGGPDSGQASSDTAPMDTDDDADTGTMCTRGHKSLSVSAERYQLVIAQLSEFETQNAALQQQYGELGKRNHEMQSTLDRIMREYNLLLTTLTQLAEADAIPPSPARPGVDVQPRELVQVRRKIRALMTTIEASQKQCRKFRSQRPEAAFLELELQAVRETLADKEEELVEMMRESDEVFAKLREAEAASAVTEEACQLLRGELNEARRAREASVQAQHDLRTTLEREHQEILDALRSDMTAIEQQMESERTALCASAAEHESRASRLQQEAQALQLQLEQREQAAQSELAAAHAAAEQSQERCGELDTQLATATSRLEALAEQCKTATLARDEAVATAQQDSALLKAEIGRLQQREADQQEDIVALRAHLDDLTAAASEKTRDADQSFKQIQELLAQVKTLQSQLAKAESDSKCQTDSHEARMCELQAQSKLETQQLEQQLEADRAQKAAELAVHEDARTQLEQSLTKLHTELDDARDGRARALAKLEQLESQNADVWERASELTVINTELTTNAAEFEDLAARQTSRIEALEGDMVSITSARDRLQLDIDAMAERHGAAIAASGAKMAELQTSLDASEHQLGCLRAELVVARELRDTTAANVDHLELQVSELSESLNSTNAQLTRSQTALAALHDDYTSLQQIRERLEQQATENVQQLDEVRAREQQACEQVRRLESSLEATHTQLLGLQQDMAETDQNKSAVAMLNAQLTSELEAKSTTVSELQTRIATLTSSLSAAMDTQQQHVDAATRWEEQTAATNRLIDELRNTADQYQASVLRLEKQISDELWPRIDSLQLELQSAQDARSADARDHEAQTAELRAKVGQLEEQLDRHRKQAHELEQQAAGVQQTLQTQLADLCSVQQETSNALEESKCANQALEEQLATVSDDLDRQLRNVQAQLDNALHECQCKEAALLELTAKHADAATKSSTMSALVDTLRAELESKADELQRVQSSLTEQQRRFEAVTAETNQARVAAESETAHLQAKLEEAHAVNSRLNALADSDGQAKDAALRDLAKARQALESAQISERQTSDRLSELSADNAQLKDKLNTLTAESQLLADTREQLQTKYDALSERARDAQTELEQALAAASSELSSKAIALADLEAVLDQANASIDAARSNACGQSSGEIEKLESTVLSLETQLAESIEAVDALVQERDRAHASIDTLKDMMTELAQVKNGEISELEQQLEKHQELLETSVKEGLQKDEAIQQLKAASASRARETASLAAGQDQALAQKVRELETLTLERQTIQAELDNARTVVNHLQAEIARHTSEATALEARLEQQKQSAPDPEGGDFEREAEKLRALNSKLERKNAKLRDVYKADISELHAEEEKQRLRAESLVAELDENNRRLQKLTVECEQTRQELLTCQQRNVELETKVANLEPVAKPKSPALHPAPLPSSSTPGNAGAGEVKPAIVRLAFERTPMKTENKRVHASTYVTRSPAGMLSPVPSSRLNARPTASEEVEDACPPRKRTAALPDTVSKSVTASSKTAEIPRTRSNYGDRRRIRRNQPPSTQTGGGLEEQAADQCVQQ